MLRFGEALDVRGTTHDIIRAGGALWLQKDRLHQRAHPLVFHPGTDAVHQRHVIDPVVAGR